jgi:hypothetical protein
MITVRTYRDEDDNAIQAMLKDEGIPSHRMKHREWATLCAEEDGGIVGFATLRHEWGIPSLQHFCVSPHKRDGIVSRYLMKEVKEAINGRKMIVHIAKDKEWLQKAIEAYFRVKPYGETNGKFWYLVEVKR